ncbi:hypothetical protein F9C07_2284604 [Aspergillus flavus]|uniref:Uncharacterized protein n=1 Tax=Aspergillus flavus (strain ATCC 200026 / FGSC A1120 / IAM 13836 / NRRL 3357 / JCM 12722 / SRRC 167) TaxID=332952 RepID=A0A7U2QTG6_ASPFN|nr:uncharacterized protein G4B84_007821 [Aspergillus flavus NRRL3357]QMW32390.1 hypothetical protein G4B84_007821 [Aspergillus flavus NRRL3357]QRD83864.1 hypothetical protein F9C07_2284604 [Aspergillus flavus]
MAWEVVTFTVHTNTSNGITDALYANGQMQVPVIVGIKAVDQNYSPYTLTEAELKRITLVDYYNTATEIKGNWYYSTEENEFAHSLPTSRDPGQPIRQEGPQYITFWVSTTKVENKNIAARITQTTDNKVITTNSSSFNSRVTLTSREPIRYTTDDVNLVRENTSSGKWPVSTNHNGALVNTVLYNYTQNNYYVTSKLYPFIKGEIYNYDATGKSNNVISSPYLKNAYAYLIDRNDVKIFFIWPMTSESTEEPGVSRMVGSASPWTLVYAKAYVKVNQRANALCLTRMHYSCNTNYWIRDWTMNAWFRLYDRYGNKAEFYPKTDDRDTIYLQAKSSQLLATSEPDAKL